MVRQGTCAAGTVYVSKNGEPPSCTGQAHNIPTVQLQWLVKHVHAYLHKMLGAVNVGGMVERGVCREQGCWGH